jgi:hypothetical protein
MKLLAFIFLLPLAALAAPTITSRGTGGNNTGATTLACVPASTIAAGSMGLLVIAADNAGSGGATAVCPATAPDSVGNTWTRRLSVIRDPAGASAGAEFAIYTCAVLTTALTSSDNLTITWDGGASVTAKAYTFTGIAPTALYRMVFGTTAAGVTGNSSNPTTTTSSITSGHIVIAGGAAEASSGAFTDDADTSNGSWTTGQTAGFGTTTGGMTVHSQLKLTTGTATQTYNPALAAVDNAIGWISVYEELIPASSPSAFFQFFP